MKKLFILFAAVALTAMGSDVFAQGTGESPEIGSIHQYWVNGTFDTPTEAGENSTYTWWVSNNTSDLLSPITAGTDFKVTGGATYNTGTLGSSGGNGIQLVWNPVSAGNTYYLVVKENDGTCDNIKAVAIKPINAFDVIFAAIDEDGDDTDNPERCAPDIAISADGTNIIYSYGSADYIYKITSNGLYSDWTFDYSFDNTFGNATHTILFSTDGTTYSGVNASGTGITVEPDATGQATVYFKVTIDNKNSDEGVGNYEEGLDEQSMILTLTGISDGVNAPANIYMSNGATLFGEDEDIKQSQSVKARPATSPISSN